MPQDRAAEMKVEVTCKLQENHQLVLWPRGQGGGGGGAQ